MMNCPYCRFVHSEDRKNCPHCGAVPLSATKIQEQNRSIQKTERQLSGPLSDPSATDLPLQLEFSPASFTPTTAPLSDGYQPTLSLQLVSDHALSQLLPEQTGKHAFVAIPPLYTQRRPLISTRRIISGFLSVLIVCALLCSGSIYYIQASGLFARVSRIYTNTPPKSIPPTVWAKLPDPPEQTDGDRKGPALSIIPSATTTDRYDPKTYMALSPQNEFKTQQMIYLTFSVQTPKQDGRVVAKWYTNNKYFVTQASTPLKVKDIPSGEVKNGFFTMRYIMPAEGKVELYWNDQWAQTLHFVVNT